FATWVPLVPGLFLFWNMFAHTQQELERERERRNADLTRVAALEVGNRHLLERLDRLGAQPVPEPDPSRTPKPGSRRPARVATPVSFPQIETDAAFAGTWTMVKKTLDGKPQPVDRQIIVEEGLARSASDKGRSTWSWHQPGRSPLIMTKWSS